MFRNEYIGTAPYISSSPSLQHYRLGPNDQFLVLSSDGLYQYLSNQEVVSYVENFMDKFPDGDPAQYLIEELLFRAAKKAGKMKSLTGSQTQVWFWRFLFFKYLFIIEAVITVVAQRIIKSKIRRAIFIIKCNVTDVIRRFLAFCYIWSLSCGWDRGVKFGSSLLFESLIAFDVRIPSHSLLIIYLVKDGVFPLIDQGINRSYIFMILVSLFQSLVLLPLDIHMFWADHYFFQVWSSMNYWIYHKVTEENIMTMLPSWWYLLKGGYGSPLASTFEDHL